MPTATLVPAPSSIASLDISLIPNLLGMVTFSTPKSPPKSSPNILVPGKSLLLLKRHSTISEMDRFGSFKPLAICPGISFVAAVLAVANGSFLGAIVLIAGILRPESRANGRELLNGEVTIATWCVHGKTVSLHTDMDAAYDTMARVREMEKRGVHVCLAHDLYWTQDGPLKDETLLRLLNT
jgi:hypothetical protein